jgi:hypothetical protein
MKRNLKILGAALGLAIATSALAASVVLTQPGQMHSVTQTEVLVLASASTAVPTTPAAGRKAIEIYNNGPNAIYCKPGGTGAVNTTREIEPGSSWYLELAKTVAIGCRAASADQVTTAATIVTEIQ